MLRKISYLVATVILISGLCACSTPNTTKPAIAANTANEFVSPEDLGQACRDEILAQDSIPVFTYKIVKTYPHDATSYTEGLQIQDGYMFEGTGRYGKSRLLQVDLATGKAIKEHKLGPRYFGEGIVVFGNRIYELTYKSNIGFIYDKDTLKVQKSFHYPTQGWGMTTDGTDLIMSNGSAAILFLDPKTLKEKRYIVVSDNVSEIGFLNELEYADGAIYANVWKKNLIAKISPETGKVLAWIDLNGINPDPAKLKYPYVMNGIAVNPENGNLIVAGKCWPKLYEIELVPIQHKKGSLPADTKN